MLFRSAKEMKIGVGTVYSIMKKNNIQSKNPVGANKCNKVVVTDLL